MVSNPGYPAVISVQSRECGPELLERLSGATLFPERLVGAMIVSVVRRAGGSLLSVTAPPMVDPEEQIDYFLQLIPEEWPGQFKAYRDRVVLDGLPDESTRWLSDKLLDSDSLEASTVRKNIREFVDREQQAGAQVHLSYFEPSENLEKLAQNLNLPVEQADSQHISLGTKANGRRLFQQANVPVAAGTQECHNLNKLAEQIADLVLDGYQRFVIKLSSTEYGGGLGNALVDLSGITQTQRAGIVNAVLERLPRATLVDSKISWEYFVEAMGKAGVIAEEFIEGDELRSPSFQGRIVAGNEVEVLSTHDQVLGETGQNYVGSSFPASDSYRAQVIEYGIQIGQQLVKNGVTGGDYGVDFLAVRHGKQWQLIGCELNLRATGTKHGFIMATNLLDTVPNAEGRLFVDGEERIYQASDGITDPRFIGLRPRQLITAVQNSPLAYDHQRKTGVVLHLLSAIEAYGKFGAISIAANETDAERMMNELFELIVNIAR